MKILLVDDHKIIREGLRQILNVYYPSATFEECSTAEEIPAKLASNKLDIIICDLSLPGRSGLEAVQQIRQINPTVPVLVLSMHPEEQYALRVLKAGASGYITKTSGAEEIIKAVDRVLQGRKYISPQVAEALAEQGHPGSVNPHEELSDREFQVFKLLAEGKSITDIAQQLSIGLSTVSTHRSRILRKMHIKNNAELTKYAIEHHLI